jgi:regulator of protease activity HflC (stomatin/prohibitin superfamily)
VENAIINMTMTNIRTVMGSMELDSLLSQRDQINHALLGVVDQATQPWGVKMTRIEIKDINPPRDLVDSMARQMKAERDKRAAHPGSRGHALSRHSQGGGREAVGGAGGRRPQGSRLPRCRGARARGRGRSQGHEVVSEAIASGNVQAINYFVANNYMKALEAAATAPNQKVLMMPVEAASSSASIGGIAEIAKEAFSAVPHVPPKG